MKSLMGERLLWLPVSDLKGFIRAVWHTVCLEKCGECLRRHPAFQFPLLNWQDISYCRECYNSICSPPDDPHAKWYYVHFNPLKDFLKHLRWNIEYYCRASLKESPLTAYERIKNGGTEREEIQ